MDIQPLSSAPNNSNDTTLLYLPQEMIGRILSFIDDKGIQSCALVSKGLSAVTQEETTAYKLKEIRIFTEKVCDQLSEARTDLKTELFTIHGSLKDECKGLISLRSIKQKILNAKDKMVELLKRLNDDELNALKQIPTPTFFDNFLTIVALCKKIEEIMDLQNIPERDTALRSVAQILAETADFDKAAQVAKSISDKFKHDEALKTVALVALNTEAIYKAIELTQYFKVEASIFNIIYRYIEDMAKKGDVDKALKAAKSFPNRGARDNVLQSVCFVFIEKGEFAQAIKIIDSISELSKKYYVLREIAEILTRAGNIPEAIEITQQVPGDNYYGITMRHCISVHLARKGELDEAKKIAQTILHPGARDDTLKSLSREARV